MSILFGASSMIPISDAIAINFTNPIFAMLLAVFILKERVGKLGWIAVLITFSGAILLIRPDFNYSSYEPMALISILGAIALGLEATLIKLLTKVENTIQILLLNNSFLSSVIFVLLKPDIIEIPPPPAKALLNNSLL